MKTKINNLASLQKIKDSYNERLDSWFQLGATKSTNSTLIEAKNQIESLFSKSSKIFLFESSWVEYHWRGLLQNSLGPAHVMLVENPIIFNSAGQNYLLIQLRHILRQTGQMVSSQNVGRRVLFFVLRLLQELSPLSSIWMKLYLALSEKGPNSVEFKATTHFGSKNNNEISNFCPNPSVSLFLTGDQNNRDYV